MSIRDHKHQGGKLGLAPNRARSRVGRKSQGELKMRTD